MRSLGENPTEEDIENIVNEVDINKDGKIDFFEFLEKIVERQSIFDSTEDLRIAFSYFDDNGDGKISIDELRDVVTTVGDEVLTQKEVNEMMEGADKDGNGFIDYQEFIQMMRNT